MRAVTNQPETDSDFRIRSIVSLEEIENHDMIYIYHHLHIGDQLKLSLVGTNLMGDLRMKVEFKQFVLGVVILGGILKEFYEGRTELWAEISFMEKKKYLPVKRLDIALKAVKLKKVG
ncbi:hypothetical protein JYT74_01970 [Crocinitomix catalasitica]|nr:hypothetical protein [Crocinitomix catalasitica]